MPNRILKQTICTSRNINSLSLGAETLFYRLLVNCDDHGRFHAEPAIVRGYCMPTRAEATEPAIAGWMAELVSADLIWTYQDDGSEYLQITKWDTHQQIRAKRSKFPEPTDMKSSASNCKQVIANVPVIQSNPIQSESNPPSAPAAQDEPEPEQVIASDKPKPATTVFVEAFQQAQGYSISNWGAEAANAKWMIEQHYTVEDAIACRSYLKTQPFWSEKPVTLAVVRSRIGEWAAAGKPATERQPAAATRNGKSSKANTDSYWDAKARAKGLPA